MVQEYSGVGSSEKIANIMSAHNLALLGARTSTGTMITKFRCSLNLGLALER